MHGIRTVQVRFEESAARGIAAIRVAVSVAARCDWTRIILTVSVRASRPSWARTIHRRGIPREKERERKGARGVGVEIHARINYARTRGSAR